MPQPISSFNKGNTVRKGEKKGGTLKLTMTTKTPILAIDPSGTSTTGLFYFENWSKWKISSFTSENWLEQAKNLQNLVKKEPIEIIAVETSRMWKKTGYTFHFDKLIKLVGYCEYLAHENQLEYVSVSNQYISRWEKEAKEGKIAGLSHQQEQGKKGRPKGIWYFKNQPLNEHEKDAILIFYIYWVKFSKKEWPFSD